MAVFLRIYKILQERPLIVSDVSSTETKEDEEDFQRPSKSKNSEEGVVLTETESPLKSPLSTSNTATRGPSVPHSTGNDVSHVSVFLFLNLFTVLSAFFPSIFLHLIILFLSSPLFLFLLHSIYFSFIFFKNISSVFLTLSFFSLFFLFCLSFTFFFLHQSSSLPVNYALGGRNFIMRQ